MQKLIFAVSMFFLLATGVQAADTIKMSTTTSTQDSGLLEILLPEFTKDTGITVQVIAKGTGAALRDGEDGNVDVLFVHDPAREEKFVAAGFGTQRFKVMHNDFVLVGSPDDLGKIKGGKSISAAFTTIANKKLSFISRGDDSGTHAKELELWKKSGVALVSTTKNVQKAGKDTPIVFEAPAGDWYMSIGQGMGKTLAMAQEKGAYALTDRGTYIQRKFGTGTPTTLEIIVEGDENLFNPYGVIPVSPQKFPHVKHEAAQKFAQWLISPRGQAVIAGYKLNGQQVFYPDAIPGAQ